MPTQFQICDVAFCPPDYPLLSFAIQPVIISNRHGRPPLRWRWYRVSSASLLPSDLSITTTSAASAWIFNDAHRPSFIYRCRWLLVLSGLERPDWLLELLDLLCEQPWNKKSYRDIFSKSLYLHVILPRSSFNCGSSQNRFALSLLSDYLRQHTKRPEESYSCRLQKEGEKI